MTRAPFLIAFALAAAAAAQQPPPLPLPGVDLPLPAAEKKTEPKKKEAKPLPLPGTDASAKPAVSQQPAAVTAAPAATVAPKANAIPATAPAATRPSTVTLTPALAPRSGAAARSTPPSDLALRTDPDQLWTLRAFVGGERSTQQDYTDAATATRLGAEATRWFGGNWLMRGEFEWRSSRQAYVAQHATTGAPVFADENRFDLVAMVGYDVGSLFTDSGRLELTPMLGVAYLGIRNQAFPADLAGPSGGGRVRYALSSAVILQATVGYTFNVATGSTNSALGNPKGDLASRAGIALPLAGNYTLELDYVGDVLAFENTYRVANGAALGFGTSF
jgi:hypothetical protein